VISVIKDAHPTVDVEEFKDSVSDGVRYFKGQIGDDYGLKSLYFVYKIISENGSSRDQKLMVRPVSGTQLSYEFAVDFRREKLQLKDRIEYYFVVSDNDGVNGSKTSRSQTYTYKLPTLDELIENRNEDQEKTKEDLKDLLDKTNEFQKQVEKLKKEAMNSKSSDWNKMNQVNQLQEEQKNLIESLEQIKNEMNQSTEEKNQLSEMDKELLEKQEMIEKLLEQLMDDELRKLLEDLEKLFEKNDKENIKEKMEPCLTYFY
jgi:DNA repair exonuclease SbcCD ATPase subunit